MKNLLRYLLFRLSICLGFTFCHYAYSQVTLSTGSPFSQYVSGLQGPGVSISNININCDTLLGPGLEAPMMGAFNGTLANFGLSSGMVLTTGTLDNIPTPFNGVNLFTLNRGLPGDPNLNTLGAGTTNDACAVTFNFTAQCDTVRFRYVFASNEYPTFVATIDDIFGAFVSGPGYTANTNVALLPIINQHVSIATVNLGTNTQFFVANEAGGGTNSGMAYRGHTVVLEAVIPVQPCQSYTIKLVIADETDFIVDSGVFIEALSCSSDLPSVVARNFNNPNSPEAVEGCVDGILTFSRGSLDPTLPLNITPVISGTATPGVDFTIPTNISIPANQDSINIPITIINDGIFEGTETLTVSLGLLSCSPGTTLFIKDPFETSAGADMQVCSGSVQSIGTPAVAGVSYLWSSQIGMQGPLNSATPNVSLSTVLQLPVDYAVTATDQNGCIAVDTVTITYIPEPKADFATSANVCVDEATTINFSQVQPPGGQYFWDFGPGATVLSGSGAGPYVVKWNTPGLQTISVRLQVGPCSSPLVSKTINVNAIPTATFNVTSQVCANQSALLNYAGTASPTATYIWNTDGGTPTPTGPGPHSVSWNSPGIKMVSLQVVENGCTSPVFTRTTEVFPVPSSDFTIASSVCEEGPVQITYTGTGSSGAAYTWNFNGAQIQSGSGVGPYTVSWNTPGTRTVTLQVEENGCISSLNSQDIDVLADPVASISQVANQCLSGNSFAFLSSGDNDVDNYFWDFGADAQPPTSTAATPPAVSYLNPGIKTVSLVTIRSGCISDSAKISFEIVPEPSANFTTSSSGICDTECITYSYSGQSLGPLQSFNWDFGPGSIPPGSSLPNPGCIEYALPGTKDVTLTVDFKGCVTSTTQQVTINASPQISAGADVDFCEGDGGVQIDASVTGGTSPLFYSWTCDDPPNCGLSSNSIEDPFANPHAIISGAVADTITYYLEVSDVNGCASGKDSVRVIVKAKPIMDAGPDVFICTDGPGDFITGGVAAGNNAPFPITFLWTPASGLNDNRVANPFARPDTTTIYTLQGSSVNGCNSEVNTLDTLSTVTVHVLPKPVAFAGRDTAICLSESVMLQGFAAGGGPDYSYSWTPATPGTIDDPNSATPLVSPNFSTTFSLVVTSNGCDSDADQVEVLVGTQPTITPGAAETICLRDSVQLNGAAAGDPNASSYTYSWSPAIGLSNPNIAKPKASPAVTTTYKVKASSNFGCGSDEAEIIVTVEPTPEVMALSADTVICQGDTINLRATHSFTTPAGSPVVYDWTPENGVLDAASQPEVRIAPGQTTLYTVQASIAGDCPTTDQVLVTVSPRVDASLSADTTQFCEGDATQLTATGGRGNATFTWMPPTGLDDPTSATPMASPNTTTTYVVEIREGACADTDEITLTINPRPEADYFASQADGCLGMTVSFIENTTDGIAFQWDFGDGSPVSNEANPSHTYEQAGSYVVTLTTIGVGGCEASVSSTTVNVSGNSFADFTSNPIVDQRLALPQASVNFADLSQNAQSWFWDFGDGKISTEKDPAHSFEQAGSYTVSLTVTDQNGCTSTISYGPYEVFEPEVMIPNVFTPNQDGVNDAFKVDYNGNELFNMVVFDRWGRQFYQADAPDKPWDGTDSEGNPAQEGVYYYSVSIGEKNFSGNVTLMR